MYEIKGIGVFGEDIVESTNSWVHFSHDDKEEDIYEESIRYYQPEAYEMIKVLTLIIAKQFDWSMEGKEWRSEFALRLARQFFTRDKTQGY